jgi:perosamine synthetase
MKRIRFGWIRNLLLLDMIMSKPSITDLEKHFVERAMENDDIGVGPFIGQFEHLWAQKNGMKYGVSCNSGTNAIYLALKALGIGPGDEVIVPEYTMIATAWAVSYTGATPVFVDCGDDLNIQPHLIREKVTERTKAIILVPIYGREIPQSVYTGARFDQLFVIEDMAEAHGIQPIGDIACYSFYGNKILTTGEGGMCITDNKEWADEMRSLSNMYMDEKRTYLHPKQGHNFRMTNLQAAVGLAQVMRMEEILKNRDLIQDWYDQNLPEHVKMPRREVLWFMDVDLHDRQEEVKQRLELDGIPSRYFFKPMSQQPQYFNESYKETNAYKWSKRGLYLPVWTDMLETDVKQVCTSLKNILDNPL